MNANSEFQTPGIRVPSRSFAVRKADVSALEREIDELVYALFALTPEEIKLVEGASVQTSARQGGAR